MNVQTSIVIDRPIEQVWAYLDDHTHELDWRSRHTVRSRNQRRPGRLPIRERADSIRAAEPRLLEGGQLRGLGYRVLRELCPRKGRRSHPPDSRAQYGAQQTRGPTCHATAGSDWFARGHADACEAEGCGRESSPQFLAAVRAEADREANWRLLRLVVRTFV